MMRLSRWFIEGSMIKSVGDYKSEEILWDHSSSLFFAVRIASSRMRTPSKKYPHITFENGIWRGQEEIIPERPQLGKKLLKKLRQWPDFVGQIDSATGANDTFGEMMDRSIRCALWLKKQGLGPGDVVSLSTYNDFNTIIPILACLYIGCTLNTFLMNSLDEDFTAHFINTVEPKIVFANEDATKLITRYNENNGKNVKIVTFHNSPNFPNFNEILKESSVDEVKNFECYEVPSRDETAMIVFSSGTTGLPKAFVVSHERISRPPLRKSDELFYESIITWRSRVCWLYSMKLVLTAILQKSTYLIISNQLDIPDYCKLIEKYKVNGIDFDVNDAASICQLENIEDYDFTSVKFVSWTGGRTRVDTQEKLAQIFKNAWLSQIYGVTEFGGLTYAMRDSRIGSCGIPMPNVELKIKNSSGGLITQPNEVGQFYAKNPNLIVNYYRNPVDSKKVIDSDGWFCTGDLGYYDENGEFFIVDRIKEFIRFRIDDVPPSVIEKLILMHPAVAHVAVVAKLHDEDIEQPMAFIVKKSNSQVTEEEIKDLVEKNLPNHMRLRGGVAFIEKMPYNTSGKVDKKKLRRVANNCWE